MRLSLSSSSSLLLLQLLLIGGVQIEVPLELAIVQAQLLQETEELTKLIPPP